MELFIEALIEFHKICARSYFYIAKLSKEDKIPLPSLTPKGLLSLRGTNGIFGQVPTVSSLVMIF